MWLLPASEFVAGARWSCHSTFASTRGFTEARDLTLAVTGLESILLDGQTVEALRVDSTLGFGSNPHVTGNASEWFVRGIGLVKREAMVTTSGVTGSNNLELQTYSIPQPRASVPVRGWLRGLENGTPGLAAWVKPTTAGRWAPYISWKQGKPWSPRSSPGRL